MTEWLGKGLAEEGAEGGRAGGRGGWGEEDE